MDVRDVGIDQHNVMPHNVTPDGMLFYTRTNTYITSMNLPRSLTEYPHDDTNNLKYSSIKPIPMSLAGKIAIVTGASRGIGASIALELAKQGAYVYISSHPKTSKQLTKPR